MVKAILNLTYKTRISFYSIFKNKSLFINYLINFKSVLEKTSALNLKNTALVKLIFFYFSHNLIENEEHMLRILKSLINNTTYKCK